MESGKLRQPNTALRRERCLRGWSQSELARRLNDVIYQEIEGGAVDLSSRGGATVDMIRKWEGGINTPSRFYQQRLCQLFQRTTAELGLMDDILGSMEQQANKQTNVQAIIDETCRILDNNLGSEHRSKEPVLIEAKETLQQISDINQNSVYVLTEAQFASFAALLKLGESIMFDPTRRQTLEALLATISIALVKPQGLLQPSAWHQLLSPESDLEKMSEATLQGFEKLIEACWQLSRGNELGLAEELLPQCMMKLVPLAQQPSPHQQAAADLAAQGFRLYSIFALHRNDLLAREMYCKQAVQYSHLAGNQNLLIASLKGLADTYYYGKQYPQALQTYKDALPLLYTENVSQLLQSRVYMGLAVTHAYVDQEQSSLEYLGLATDTFPDAPQADSSFFYADYDLSQLILWEGIARSQLGQTQQSLDIFARIEQPNIIAPSRVRTEIVNWQAKTAIVSGDLEQSVAYVEMDVAGAKTLKSQRRYNEAYSNFNQMCLIWPQEARIKTLKAAFYA